MGVISLTLDYFKNESSCISALKALGLWGMGPAVSLFDGFQDALIDICSISLTVLGVPSMAVNKNNHELVHLSQFHGNATSHHTDRVPEIENLSCCHS